MRFLKFALAGACAFGLVGLTPATAAEPVKIRMSWVAPVANWASIVLEKKDLAKHMGKSYTVESVRYQGTPQMITAIANNELEVSNLAYSSLAIAIENAGLDDIRVIADEFQDGVPGYYTRNTSSARTAASTRSRTSKARSSAPTPAAAQSTSPCAPCSRKHGLEEKRDYTMVESPLPAMPAVLLEKKADLVPAVLPFAFNPKLRGRGQGLVQAKRSARRDANDRVDRAQVLHRQEPRRHGRFHGGHAAHHALVPRSEEP